MARRVCRFIVVITLVIKEISASYAPTTGSVWPKPAQELKGNAVLKFNSDGFSYEIKHHGCKLLEKAIERCKDSVFSVEGIVQRVTGADDPQKKCMYNPLRAIVERVANKGLFLQDLRIHLKQPCERYPYMGMDESYNLTVSTTSRLISTSIWGIIRGLETFSQLFYLSKDYREVLIQETEISDYPQYPHRGMLVDTSRHFLPVTDILTTLDAMAMNKMNVFHWHIVDDPSFPFQSDRFPELSAKGAYYPTMVYTRQDVRTILDYARDRGIRVVPEFDTPGHATSWGASHPEILATCTSGDKAMNPVINETYDLIKEFFQEVQDRFPDRYLHLGGDEVNVTCWKSDPKIKDYMKKHNITDPYQLQKMFTRKLLKLLRKGTIPIVWEEVFLNARASLPNGTLVQIWNTNWETNTLQVLRKGHKAIISSNYYLNYKFWQREFQDFYAGEPRTTLYNMTKSHNLGKNIMGGEACLWGEMVDANNLVSRMWPRGAAVAEVLWSFTNGTVPKEAYNRIEEHTCRMIRRGVAAAPSTGPGFCVTIENAMPDNSDNETTNH